MGIPSGAAMMMKSMLGIDPSELEGKIMGSVDQFKNLLQSIDTRLAALEEGQREIKIAVGLMPRAELRVVNNDPS